MFSNIRPAMEHPPAKPIEIYSPDRGKRVPILGTGNLSSGILSVVFARLIRSRMMGFLARGNVGNDLVSN
jgi:hypothetical protein